MAGILEIGNMDFVHFCFIFAACFYSDTKGASGYLVYVDKPATWDEARSNCTFTYKGRLASLGEQDLQRNTLASCVPSATDVWTGKYFEIDPSAKDKMTHYPSIDWISAIQQCVLKQKDILLEGIEVNCEPATRLTSGKEIDLTLTGILKQDEGKDCSYTEKGTEYMGFKNKTVGKKDCLIWSVARPDKYMNVTNNYCRNPTNEATPWCYICADRSRGDCRNKCKVNRCDVPWGVVTIRREDSSTWTEEFKKYTNDKRRTYLCETDSDKISETDFVCTSATTRNALTGVTSTRGVIAGIDLPDTSTAGHIKVTDVTRVTDSNLFLETSKSFDTNPGLIGGIAGTVCLLILIIAAVVIALKRCGNTNYTSSGEKTADDEKIPMQDQSISKNMPTINRREIRNSPTEQAEDIEQESATSGGINTFLSVNNRPANRTGANVIEESNFYYSIDENQYEELKEPQYNYNENAYTDLTRKSAILGDTNIPAYENSISSNQRKGELMVIGNFDRQIDEKQYEELKERAEDNNLYTDLKKGI